MSKTSGADPITREQVERLLVEVQSTTDLATAQVALGILGNGWLSVCPPYVAEFFDVRVTLPEAFRAALTRWRDELAAAETPRGWTRHSSGSYWCLHCNATGDAPGDQDCANCGGLGWRAARFLDDEEARAEAFHAAPEVVDVLAAAEPVRRVARWDADLEAYTLTPTHDDGALMTHAVEDAAKARAWGYTIEGGPEPIDDTAPERLRERREALGLSHQEVALAVNADTAGFVWDAVTAVGRDVRPKWTANDVALCETPPFAQRPYTLCRAIYAAALSAEEARRVKLAAERDAHAVPRLGWLEPERPVPRFKVGDWVRVVCNGTVYQVGEIATPFGGMAYYFRETGGAENSWQAAALEPASPPAPEVVDVPQPIVKRLRSAEAQWCRGETVMRIEVDESGYVYAPLALLRAMLADIDAQQGGAS